MPLQGRATPNERRVLIVDDDRKEREVLWQYLKAHGWSVAAAGDGLTALQILDHEDDFGAVVADERLAGLAGARLLSWVKYISPATKCVLFAAYPSSWAREIANDIGAHIIEKGGDDSLRELIEALDS